MSTFANRSFREATTPSLRRTAFEGLAALESCDPPTLVLLDHTMPRMDGPAFDIETLLALLSGRPGND